MKEKSFYETMEKTIADKRSIKTELQNELLGVEREIEGIKCEIKNFTNTDDLSTYTGLKDKLEILENKKELIRKNLNAENKAPDESIIRTETSAFFTEKKKLEDEYGAQMLEIIRQLKTVFDESEVKKGSLKALYDGWVQVFNIPMNYHSYNSVDPSGISARVRQLLNSMSYIEKL